MTRLHLAGLYMHYRIIADKQKLMYENETPYFVGCLHKLISIRFQLKLPQCYSTLSPVFFFFLMFTIIVISVCVALNSLARLYYKICLLT